MNSSQYFSYLLDLVKADDNHGILLSILFGTDFRWSVPNDDNRMSDGMNIRYNYAYEHDILDKELDELMLVPCSVMEVVCGLAIRMDDIMRDPIEPHIDRWFWEMLENLGVSECTDTAYEKGAWTPIDLYNILDIFMDRKYDELGHGGLFPRNFCDKNLKEIELFSQMNGYLSEKYC